MKLHIFTDPTQLGQSSGSLAAEHIKQAIQSKGQANIILATGTSQFETLNQLIQEKDIDWSKVVLFHLDEYIGLKDSHPASFRKYLKERFIQLVPALKSVNLINGEEDALAECQRLNSIILQHPIDVALVGIGENGHLAFNDPPANFETKDPYIVVQLDEACRMQQMGEGWFPSLEDVPKQAISMSIQHIMASKKIICSVPDYRKAEAVKNCLENEVSPWYPASILQKHADCSMFLDQQSAELLSANFKKQAFNA
ncbi:glucosamine-6-phosphate deaminase [Aquirufa aurantiipilula]|uniref:glucosamine-6-phosphate deaminase n=1 Tax=Aquirufa aurantiipilula TaxID=2696561 RepID=UPI0021D42EAD|nr:glucosamine-6-phosphate deaminase [Aquirufa aurantiipilula]